MYLQQANACVFDGEKKREIRLMLKKNKVVMRHLIDIKQAFLSCEQEKLGLISQSIF